MSKRNAPDGSKAPALAAAAQDTAKARRAKELTECQDRVNALLEEYDATFAVLQQMSLGPDFAPRYGYTVRVVSR